MTQVRPRSEASLQPLLGTWTLVGAGCDDDKHRAREALHDGCLGGRCGVVCDVCDGDVCALCVAE